MQAPLVARGLKSVTRMKRLLSFALLAACGDSPTEIPEVKSDVARDLQPNVSAADFATLVDGNTEFATDLYREVRDEPGNLFMSPHSISIALAMTYAGANTNTAGQMADTLHFTLPGDQTHSAFNKLDLELASRAANAMSGTIPFKLQTANAIFGQKDKTFMEPFLDTLARNYGAGLRVLDFNGDPDGSRLTINDWVEDRTNDKIKDLLPPNSVTSDTRLVLTNAIYFSAAWDEPFKADETADRAFKLADGTTISVPTLHQTHERGYAAGDGYKVAELPYDGGQLSMVVVVPDNLAAFEASLDAALVKNIMASIQTYSLELSLPKFKFDAPLGLKEVLTNLGMTDAFQGGLADFSGIDGTRNLAISDVLHKGFVAIDENGTEAAAATAVIIGDTSAPEPATLAVDKPFVFFIRDRPTGAILFVGRVVDPR
jgi:serpin B